MRKDKVSPDTIGSQPKKGKVREYLEAFVIALVIALIVRSLFLQAFKIPSGSMENTLLVGDHIFVNKVAYGYHIPFTKGRVLELNKPRHGDIMVFVFPEDPSKDFIKRVIGVPGDVIEVKRKSIVRNGETLKEDYAQYIGEMEPDVSGHAGDDLPPITVPPDNYFVLGDNRDRSYDSRFWGFVGTEAVIGKAMFVYFSIDWSRDVGLLEVWRWPELIRWNRIGSVLK
ncbi:MAG: signal peptidase I [Syntrophorhabdaceae bacterium]|nr:signal peptidase I [Syntrophorhabdaceae bacterium]